MAAAIFALAMDHGGYALESRGLLAIAVWWTILVAAGLRLMPLAPPPRAALVVGGFLAALAAWTLLSALWAESAERTFNEFNRVSLYLGLFALVVFATRAGNGARWLDGLGLGITGIATVALVQRFFPALIGPGEIQTLLPAAAERLSYPIGYWNGLAVLVALGIPLLLRTAAFSARWVTRALAVAPLPAFASVLYLTSSRGGILVAIVGILSLLGLATRKWPILAAVIVGATGSVAALAVLLARNELVNGPLDSGAAASQGRSAALLIALLSAGTAAVYRLGELALGGRLRIPRWAGRSLAGLAVVAVVVGVAVADPATRFEEFKQPPDEALLEDPDFVRAHLGSAGASGRWQYWTAAVAEFEQAPVLGEGAGSYEAWWTQHRTIAQPVEDAHSLYLETLGELGLVGFALVVGLVGVGLLAGVLRSRRAPGGGIAAAATAAFAAYAVSAGIDWMWELTAVSAAAVICVAIATGPATSAPAATGTASRRSRSRFVAAAAALTLVWALLCAQAVPLLADAKIDDSQAAVRRGDGRAALEHARTARNIQPWAASPYLQLALVEERFGQIGDARGHLGEAIQRDPRDWRLWLIAARMEVRAGDVAAARESLERARGLNPRSPLIAGLGG